MSRPMLASALAAALLLSGACTRVQVYEPRPTPSPRVLPTIADRVVADGASYPRLRIAVQALVATHFQPLQNVLKTVGGLYVARDHRGDPDARPPFTPVPAARQREAVALIVEQAFAEGVFRLEPGLLNHLAPVRFALWREADRPLDYPIHNVILSRQQPLLFQLTAPPRLTRIVDNGARVAPGEEAYTIAELLDALTAAIWSELGAAPAPPRATDTFRRNLQRLHLTRFIDLLTASPAAGAPQIPGEARALARLELAQLSERIGEALERAPGLEVGTRAHLLESKARVDRALEASVSLPPGR